MYVVVAKFRLDNHKRDWTVEWRSDWPSYFFLSFQVDRVGVFVDVRLNALLRVVDVDIELHAGSVE